MAAAVVCELRPEMQGQVETRQYDEDRNGNILTLVNTLDATQAEESQQPASQTKGPEQEVLEEQSQKPEEDKEKDGEKADVPASQLDVAKNPEEVPESEKAVVPSSQLVVSPQEVPESGDIAPFQADKSESEPDIEETVAQCKQCGVSCAVLDMVERNPNQLWCKSCNCITTTLRRHLAWPPQGFTSLSLQEQQGFWQDAAKTKQEGDNFFRYDRIRDVLRQRLVTRKINQSKREVGGKYRPLDVLKRKGYPIPPNFEATVPREWNESLQTWCYLLAEVSVNESQVNETIEETLLEAERLVKKKKLQPPTEGQVAMASSSAPGAHMVFDLVSVDEDEVQEVKKTGQLCFFHSFFNLFSRFSPLVHNL